MTDWIQYIELALQEDIGNGDHSSLCCIDKNALGSAKLIMKDIGIVAGIDVAETIFCLKEPNAVFTKYFKDGSHVNKGDIIFEIKATVHTLLQCERLVLNIMQRMSGIASLTAKYVEKVKDYKCILLDTRKTTPNFRWFEKRAVTIGGAQNHRMGLYDMIMLKDNHIDFCGSIEKAIEKAYQYIQNVNPELKIEVETRNIEEVKRAVACIGVHRIMLDNFTPSLIMETMPYIPSYIETEVSGGINLDNIEAYAATGVTYISVGAMIHHAVSMDMSLKANLL